MTTEIIPGYTYGTDEVASSPVSLDEFRLLQQTVLWTDDDERYLRLAGVLDLWYSFVGSQEHLVYYFADPDGQPIEHYLTRVRERFGQGILDTCRRSYDQAWLDYQMEIALRHTRARKNATDGVQAATNHIPLRYIIVFIYPITATMRDFLARKGHAPEEVEKMHQAWFKAVTLQVTLWSYPYAREGDF